MIKQAACCLEAQQAAADHHGAAAFGGVFADAMAIIQRPEDEDARSQLTVRLFECRDWWNRWPTSGRDYQFVVLIPISIIAVDRFVGARDDVDANTGTQVNAVVLVPTETVQKYLGLVLRSIQHA
jgi:hypothetical protein